MAGTPNSRTGRAQPPEHHRGIQGGVARAAVLGVSDGLVTNVSLILGVAGASTTTPGFVRLTGMAGLLAGAFSMAAGEYVSMRAQRELLERELEMEAIELRRSPAAERAELAQLYESRGVDPEVAGEMAGEMMRTPELALQTHAREELGVNPDELGDPYQAAWSSAGSFAVGAIVPLLPWFFLPRGVAVVASLVLGAVASICIGIGLARFTGRWWVHSALRQLVVTIAAAGFTFGIGHFLGAQVTG